VETRIQGNDGSAAQLIRYQFNNHLGSASLELDDQAQVISYEEYCPYGNTSYQAGRLLAEIKLKRYRYTGMERDEESGLSYHTARYYATWLARWTSSDPIELAGGGPNLYCYASGDPVCRTDRHGKQPSPPRPRPPLPPPPVPGQTPHNFVAESPARGNWERSVNEILEEKYGKGSVEGNAREFERQVQSRPSGARKTAGTRQWYANEIYDQVRGKFYEFEGENPSFSWSTDELRLLREGYAPRPGFQIHHVEWVKDVPTRALGPENALFTQAGETGGLARGTPHYELHYGQGARDLKQFQSRQAANQAQAGNPVQPEAPSAGTGAGEPNALESPPVESQPITRGPNLGPRVRGALGGAVAGELLNIAITYFITGKLPSLKEVGKGIAAGFVINAVTPAEMAPGLATAGAMFAALQIYMQRTGSLARYGTPFGIPRDSGFPPLLLEHARSMNHR
jgi:RHS repeat-associated protein